MNNKLLLLVLLHASLHECEDKDAVLLHNGSMGVRAWQQWHARWGI